MLTHRLGLLGLTVATFLAAPSQPALAGAPSSPPRFEDRQELKDLPARWAPLLEEFLVAGLAIGVVKDGETYAIATFGTRDAKQTTPVTADTFYYIASVTKVYNAFLVSRLAEQGRLSLEDPVAKHLPRFKLAEGVDSGSITIRELLTHEAGLNSEPIATLDAYTGEITEDRFYRFLANVTPDKDVRYSNLHYTLLGRVIESVTGSTWRDALERDLFKPAGMTRTTGYASRMYGDPDHADPMSWRPESGFELAEFIKNDATMHAAGGLGTTARDAAAWLILNLNQGEINGARLLGASFAAEMRREQSLFPKPRGSLRIMTGHGLGWETGTFAGRPFLSHGGGYEGAAAYFAMLPDQHVGFFILMNRSGPAMGLGDVMAIDLLNRLTGENVAPDLLDDYLARVRKGRAEMTARPPEPRGGVLPLDSLSAPPGEYVRNYANADWGTLSVSRGAEGMQMKIGAITLRVKPNVADAFTVVGPLADGGEGRFEKNDQGQVARIRLNWPEVGEIVFER